MKRALSKGISLLLVLVLAAALLAGCSGSGGNQNRKENTREFTDSDVGEAKTTIVEDMDQLQDQTGIPTVHITATLEGMDEASELEDYKNLYRNIDQSEEVEQEDEGLTEYGTVYIDEDGNLYVLEN